MAKKRQYLNMRCTPELRARIERACAKSGRSIAAEVEHCIEQAYTEDKFADVLARVDAVLRRVTRIDSDVTLNGQNASMSIDQVHSLLLRLVGVLLDGPTEMSSTQRSALRGMLRAEEAA